MAKVSICIPTFKQPEFLIRLLDSILHQTYKNVEVIVSDDSADVSIKNVYTRYADKLDIHYYQHQPSLKTPKNWNFALDHGTGSYLMLMHQDDWFNTSDAIFQFVNILENYKEVDFVFSRNTLVFPNGNSMTTKKRRSILNNLENKYDMLPLHYVIGPPSNIMVRSLVKTRYDEQFIWLVDVDYCVRTLRNGHKPYYIDSHLVSIGMHPGQTTEYCLKNPEIILKENILYTKKLEKSRLKPIMLYDYFWRIIRNHKVRKMQDIYKYDVSPDKISPFMKDIISFQSKIPSRLLNIGILSKFFMTISYIKFRISSD